MCSGLQWLSYKNPSFIIFASLFIIIIIIMRVFSKLSLNFRFAIFKQWVQQPAQISKKALQLAKLIANSNYPIFFTGAGISTSIGIPDYRSGHQTVVPTGPGVWNRIFKEIPQGHIQKVVDQAIPSLTHMAIKSLVQKQIFEHVISQNTDGLHLKSGLSVKKISEIHGNRNLQKCENCNRAYFRDYRTIKRKIKQDEVKTHYTGRNCQNCGGQLKDSIVYFGEKLPKEDLTRAFIEAGKCDLLVSIGSSLTVKPSSNVLGIALKKEAKLAIINIQQTPFSQVSTLNIHGFCDDVMKQTMDYLNIQIEPYRIEHYMKISVKNNKMKIQGKSKQGQNYTYIQSVEIGDVEYPSNNHIVEFPVKTDQNNRVEQICLKFYGAKVQCVLNLLPFFKIYHGEEIFIKIQKKYEDNYWLSREVQLKQ